MSVAAHELAGDDHDRPDDEIDDDLFGVADGSRGIEITSDDLEQSNHQRDEAEETDQGLLDPIPPMKRDGSLVEVSLVEVSLGPGHGSAAAAGFGQNELDHLGRDLDVPGHLVLLRHHQLLIAGP